MGYQKYAPSKAPCQMAQPTFLKACPSQLPWCKPYLYSKLAVISYSEKINPSSPKGRLQQPPKQFSPGPQKCTAKG